MFVIIKNYWRILVNFDKEYRDRIVEGIMDDV